MVEAEVAGEVPAPMRRNVENDRMILFLALGVILLAFLLQATPDRQGVSLLGWQLPEVCGVKRIGGTCPGCGLTRSFVLGIRGDLESFSLHPAGPILLLLVVAQVPYRGVRLYRARALRREDLVDLGIQTGSRGWGIVRMAVVVVLVVGWVVNLWLHHG